MSHYLPKIRKMKDKENVEFHRRLSGRFLIALLLVLSGIMMLARNTGWITNEAFDAIVSWQTLLVILGIYSIIHRHYISGLFLLAIGSYLLLGSDLGISKDCQTMVWPVALIVMGILFYIKSRNRHYWIKKHQCRHERLRMRRCSTNAEGGNETIKEEYTSEDGYLNTNNVFGGVRHVVLDETFKGANIRTSFGGTTIDLRRTHILPGETYIDIDCNWGGIELYIPSDWKVIFKCNSFFGGYEDKRWQDPSINQELILVIRGNISFGGLEIKD